MWSKKPYRNVVGLSQPKLDELLKNFEKLKDFGGDLFDRAVRYVLDGEDEAVLGELAGKNDAAHALGLMCSTPYGHTGEGNAWNKFLAAIEPIDCGFYLRLAKLFEAAARNAPAKHFFCQAVLDNNRWLEIVLQEASNTAANVWTSTERRSELPAQLIEEMLRADGRSVEPFLTSAFRTSGTKWDSSNARNMILGIRDLGKSYAAHYESIAHFLTNGPAASRETAVRNLARVKAPASVFIKELVECATDSSKLVREVAEPLVRSEPMLARPLLENTAQDPKSAKREQAVRLLARIYGDAARSFLQEKQHSEKNAAVQEAIANSLRELECQVRQEMNALPPREPIPLNPPITPALRDCLKRLFDDYNLLAAQGNATSRAPGAIGRYAKACAAPAPLSQNDLETVSQLLQDGGNLRGILANSLDILSWHMPQGSLKVLLEHPDWHLVHAMRFLSMLDAHRNEEISWGVTQYIEQFRRSHGQKLTLLDLAQVMATCGISAETLAGHILGSSYLVFNWGVDAVWPFFSDKSFVFEKAFEPPTGDWSARWQRKYELTNALRLLHMLPSIPPSLVAKLWDMAIGTNKADRLRAQRIVAKLPDLSERLQQALMARASETRAVATEWIGRSGERQYIPALHKAAKAEKHDAALDEILTALEKLGEDVEPFLNRDKLMADAQKGLKKGTPPALEWFPWAQLPKVQWQDTGKEVPKEVVTWLIVQNFKFKSSEAGPLLRRYCAMMRPTDRAKLGQFVLGAWLDQDLKRKLNDLEARTEAKKRSQQTWQQYQRTAQWYQQQGKPVPVPFNQTIQQVEESIFQQLQREVGTAVAEKGVLAVAGACCDASAVGPVQKYLKDWYGYRAAQCKALIAMLSSIDHPSATQFLLSIANRFRTKGIREEAEKYVNLLAERKGWTLDELADRTLPTAGFGDDGTLELSFGPRQFQLRVTPKLEAVLTDGDGKALKALPAPRKDDDEEQAKAAKKAFSAAKTELKKFTLMQTTRLYEAMCTQRAWTVADWQTYLMGHPLMKFLCQRLVWAARVGDGVVSTFRPLDDGSFTDFEDNDVQLAAYAKIRVAHSCQLPSETSSAWTAHLADYDVAPIFTQFGRTTYSLPEGKGKETAINDFEGHLVEAFKLRSLATKVGYTRGQTQDGGWFYDYLKSFPGLGLKVVLEFSGNGLPEENRTVALKQIYFQQSAAEEEPMIEMSGGMALDEVPAVLLSECYNDLRTIAAAGTGFDPEWEKKVGY
jgi:hypothetical protein